MEIEVLEIAVKQQVLTVTTAHTFVADTQNIYTASFSFDEEWDGFGKTVIFRNNDTIRFAILDMSNRCVIPRDVIKFDRLEIGVQGNKDGQIITTKKADYIEIFESGGSINMVPAPFEQSEFDKLMDELARVQKIAEQSIADAEQSHVDAQQVAADKTEVANNKAVVLQKATEVANNTKVATTAATTATAQATISQNLYDQLQPMNVDVSSKAPSIVSEAAGSVITLDDSSNMPLQSLTIYGKSVQDGTPTPEAPVEIVSVENPELGVAGSILLDFDDYIKRINNFSIANYATYKGVKCVRLDSGSLGVRNTLVSFPRSLKPNTNYIINLSGYVAHRDNLNDNVAGIMFILNKKDGGIIAAAEDRFYNIDKKQIYRKIVNTGNDIIGLSFSYGTIRENYLIVDECYIVEEGQEPVMKPLQSLTFPYALRGIPVSSGGNYIDESGQQWVCDTLEVNANGTGKLVQRCVGYEFNGIETWNKYTLAEHTFSRGLGNIIYTGFSSHYANGNKEDVGKKDVIYLVYTNTVIISDLRFNTLEEWKAYLASQKENGTPVQVVGCLLSSAYITTDLTAEEVQAFLALHTNNPYSTIFNSAGADQRIEYVADTKRYIDNKFTELQNAILSTGGNV